MDLDLFWLQIYGNDYETLSLFIIYHFYKQIIFTIICFYTENPDQST